MRQLLALDLSTYTGWAIGPPDGEPRFGTKILPKTGDDLGPYLAALRDWLVDLLTLEDPALVVYEAPVLGRNTAHGTALKLMNLAGTTELVCHDRAVPVRSVDLQTVKKTFAGHGHAKKEHMIARAHALGWMVRDDNAADACGVWVEAIRQKKPEIYQQRFARQGRFL